MAAAQSGGKQERIRESIGTFVLYPGNESFETSFPQMESIDQVNVGAVPLLPAEDEKHIGGKLRERIKNVI